MHLQHKSISFNIRNLNPFVNILLHKNRAVKKNNERKRRKMLESVPLVPFFRIFAAALIFPLFSVILI